MKSLRRLLGSLVLATVATGPAFASSMPTVAARPDQQNLRWKGRQIRVALSNSLTQPSFNIKLDSDVMGAVLRSFKTWEEVSGIQFITETSEKQNISPSEAGDGISLITIGHTPENVLLFSTDPDKESAKTRIFYNRRGFITEADIVLNPFQMFSTDGSFGTFDLQATLTHEIGHLLGLRHSGVLGATMSESFSKNGTFGIPDLSARILAKNDIAAIRELYEADDEDDTCCGAITGKITGPNGRPLKASVRIWAAQAETGRVFAQGETGPDGVYRLGGLPDSEYSLFWQMLEEGNASFSDELGSVEIVNSNSVTFNAKVSKRSTGPRLEYIGINSRLANTAVPVRSGRNYMVYLGGRDLDAARLTIDFGSPFVRAASVSYARPDMGESASVISFFLTIDDDAPAGLYSIFVTGDHGGKTSMIGALKVE
jgi:hypothetical protein